MKPWVRAGIAGGILQVIFTLPILLMYFLPLGIGMLFALCICGLFFLLYPVPGILSVHWSPAPRHAGQAAGAGALAGLLATGIDSIVTLLLSVVLAVTGINGRYMEQMIPNATEILRQTGMEFWISNTGQVLQTGISLIFHIITGVILSVFGAIIYAAIKKE